MELTKEEMKLVIRCLSDIKFLNQTITKNIEELF